MYPDSRDKTTTSDPAADRPKARFSVGISHTAQQQAHADARGSAAVRGPKFEFFRGLLSGCASRRQ
mgnify:CR=1 FL=1